MNERAKITRRLLWRRGALAALKSDKRLTELAEQNEDRVDQITQRKSQLQERARDVFATASERSESA